MEVRRSWRMLRPLHFFLLMCFAAFCCPRFAAARLFPQGNPNKEVEEVRDHQAPHLEFIMSACVKHHIACHLVHRQLREHREGERLLRGDVNEKERRLNERENERVLSFTTADYQLWNPDVNPTVSVPIVAVSPTALPIVVPRPAP